MIQKCKTCGAKIIRFPLWKGQDHGEKFEFNKIIWLNLFKMDWMSIIFFVIIIYLVWSYQADTEECFEIIEDPCGYCERINCCEYLAQQKLKPTIDIGGIVLPDIINSS